MTIWGSGVIVGVGVKVAGKVAVGRGVAVAVEVGALVAVSDEVDGVSSPISSGELQAANSNKRLRNVHQRRVFFN
jgi:hypothetical protein